MSLAQLNRQPKALLVTYSLDMLCDAGYAYAKRLAVADNGATYAHSPDLPHEGEALGIVHQPGKIDQVGCRHDGKGSSRASAATPNTRQRHHPSSFVPTGTSTAAMSRP